MTFTVNISDKQAICLFKTLGIKIEQGQQASYENAGHGRLMEVTHLVDYVKCPITGKHIPLSAAMEAVIQSQTQKLFLDDVNKLDVFQALRKLTEPTVEIELDK